jgi:putative ABC transport system ATP-binding protein
MPILETSDLKKQYQMGEVTVDALAGVDFTVEQGEFVAIMGPSGSGKSTLLHLMGGLDGPSEGEVMLVGRQLSVLKDNEITLIRRRNVGFIFQFYNLLPTLSAEENVALPLLIDGQNVKVHQDKIDQLLDLVGLAERKTHKPNQLSGGQQQRVANLDSKTSSEILHLLRRSCDELGQTIVMVTHDASAASFADRIVFLMDGRLVGQLATTGNRADDIRQIQRYLRELEVSLKRPC